ncbi:MAG: nitroreductase family protein [Firmicutes bacterium]|nr:nitroreductase family protein [Bacillota bacterium]MDH7496749.1 nitroreductase family protein [Bacillota bacterium]
MSCDMHKTALELISMRRSIRTYYPDDVPDELLALVLEAGRQAPSGENAQPWRFIVVRDEARRKILGDIAARGSGRRFTAEFLTKRMHKRFESLEDEEKRRRAFEKLTSGNVSSFLSTAPVVIVVVGKKDVWDLPFDCSAAIENMLLMAPALGLGACWVIALCIDVRDEERVREVLNIPADYKVISAISLGYSPQHPKPRPRLPLTELVFKETFGEPYFVEAPAVKTEGEE